MPIRAQIRVIRGLTFYNLNLVGPVIVKSGWCPATDDFVNTFVAQAVYSRLDTLANVLSHTGRNSFGFLPLSPVL